MPTDKQRNNSGEAGKGRNGNLTPFKKGQSGNPRGRPPKAKYISEILRELLTSRELDGKPNPDGMTSGQLVAIAILKGAMDGDPRHIKELLDRTEGKVPEKQEVELTRLSDEELIARVQGLVSGDGQAGTEAPGNDGR